MNLNLEALGNHLTIETIENFSLLTNISTIDILKFLVDKQSSEVNSLLNPKYKYFKYSEQNEEIESKINTLKHTLDLFISFINREESDIDKEFSELIEEDELNWKNERVDFDTEIAKKIADQNLEAKGMLEETIYDMDNHDYITIPKGADRAHGVSITQKNTRPIMSSTYMNTSCEWLQTIRDKRIEMGFTDPLGIDVE